MTAGAEGIWTNWAGTAVAHPAEQSVPSSTDEVAALVSSAAARGLQVRMVGSGHSFTPVAVTDGLMLHPGRLTGIIGADPATGLVTVRAGTRLHDLGPALLTHGLAMTNLGDIDVQTVAGALSTGTHGTGARFGGLAAQVAALELVTADGCVRRVDRACDGDLFDAARVGLGAFGILTSVTLQCVPAFVMRAVEAPRPLEAVLESLDDVVDHVDHAEFYWFPHTRRTLTKANTRMPAGTARRPLPGWRRRLDDDLLSNTVFEGVNRLTTRFPAAVPAVNAVSARALSARTYTDWSFRVFATRRTVRFREMEYGIPRGALRGVLTEIDGWLRRSGERIAFPVEVRFAPADDAWLSTAYQRPSAYVAVHQYHRRDHERYFSAVESIMAEVDGRPHWGKLHGLDHERLGRLYPRLEEARALKDRLDPDGVLGNDYTDRVFGPMG